MQDENREEGISLGQLFGVMFGRKILLAIITAVIFLLGTIIFKFAINDNEKYYTSQFDFTIQGVNNGKYIDGSVFEYRDLISYENLKKIKDSDSKFSSVNVDDMYEDNKISISFKRTYLVINNEETATVDEEYYTINAGRQYFSSYTQARDYIKAIASQPLEKALSLVQSMDYSSNLKMFEQSSIYETQISYLKNQYEYIKLMYENLISYYGDIILEDNVKLSDTLANLNLYFENYNLDALIQEVEQNGYIKQDEAYISQLTVQRQALKKEKKVNEIKLTELKAQRDSLIAQSSGLQTLDLSTYNDQIISLTLRNADIDHEIKIINRKLSTRASVRDTTEFEAKLSRYKTALQEFTDEYEANEQEVVETSANVYFYANSIIVEEGGSNMVLMAAVFLVAGAIVGCIVNLCLDGKKLSSKYKKEHESVTPVENKE